MTAALDLVAIPRQAAPPDAREPWPRLLALADTGSLVEIETVDGVVSATARLDGVHAVLFATDARVQGGALGADGCAAIVRAYSRARADVSPIVGVWQSGGARLREGARSLDAVGTVFFAMTAASGVIPQISLVLGPAAGGAAYGPALTDVVVMAPEARVFVTGPDVVRSVTGEDCDAATLGGPGIHGSSSGVAHVVATDEADAHDRVRRIAGLLHRSGFPVPVEDRPDPAVFLPERRKQTYDVRPVMDALLDSPADILQANWAPNVVTALGRLHGRSIGVLANNPAQMFGCLTAEASDKAARFVRLCDAFGLPLLVLVDVPGYLPGLDQEADGVVRRGAKLLHAFAAARVPRVTVLLRRAFGGAYIALNSKSLGATRVFAWPGAELDVMDPVAAVRILRRRELVGLEKVELAAAEALFAAEHAVTTGGLARALDEGLVDEIITPAETRSAVAAAFAAAPALRGSLTNIPL